MKKVGVFGKLFRLALLVPISCMVMFLAVSLGTLLVAARILLM